MTSPWSATELACFDAARNVLIAPQRSDGTFERALAIWVVRVEDEVYVRPWFHGVDGLVQALRLRPAHIRLSGLQAEVLVEDVVSGSAVMIAVDAAYRLKYGTFCAGLVDTMVSESVADTTVRLVCLQLL